jgi:Phosphotransferase enzyme family
MSENPCANRIDRLTRTLARRLDDPAVKVEPYRDGVDCWVDLVRRPTVPLAVVRSAKIEHSMTRYEGLVDFGVVIEKEVVVARLLRGAKLPTPAVLAWHHTTDPESEPSWMLLEFVPHTPVDHLSAASHVELGRITRQIHAIEPSGTDLRRLSQPEPWSERIRRRILMRISAAGRYMSIPALKTVEQALLATLPRADDHPRALLHLDLRAPNLAIRENKIVGIFDLANAIVGDPYLELARIRGCGLLSPEFLSGYGEERAQIERNRPLLDAYELDLTALLVVVSREEINDDELHDRMVKRTTTLLEGLTAEHGG